MLNQKNIDLLGFRVCYTLTIKFFFDRDLETCEEPEASVIYNTNLELKKYFH